mmetsp:Transcript_23489/g.57089  ORF Transcript_23489/g.57089 Transcript_23489/m.57089 type:complete len:239 (+) Transcript_23489:1686-2402(+)
MQIAALLPCFVHHMLHGQELRVQELLGVPGPFPLPRRLSLSVGELLTAAHVLGVQTLVLLLGFLDVETGVVQKLLAPMPSVLCLRHRSPSACPVSHQQLPLLLEHSDQLRITRLRALDPLLELGGAVHLLKQLRFRGAQAVSDSVQLRGLGFILRHGQSQRALQELHSARFRRRFGAPPYIGVCIVGMALQKRGGKSSSDIAAATALRSSASSWAAEGSTARPGLRRPPASWMKPRVN